MSDSSPSRPRRGRLGSIRVQLPLTLFLLGAVLTVAGLWLALGRVESSILARRGESLGGMADVAARLIADAAARGELSTTRDVVRRVGGFASVRDVALVDEAGRVLEATRSEWVGQPVSATSLGSLADLARRVSGGAEARVERRPGDRAVVAAPVPGDRRVLLFDSDLSTILAWGRRETLLHYGGLAAITMLLILVLAFYLDRRVVAPAHRLACAAARLGSGDRSARTGLSGGDEIRAAGSSFDRMAERILAAEESARAQQRLIETVLEALPLGVVAVAREDGRILFTNAWWRESLGLADVRPGEDHRAVLERLRFLRPCGDPYPFEDLAIPTALRTGQPATATEVVVERPDGTRLPIVARAAPVALRGEGGFDAVLSVMQSRADVERLFDELRRSEFLFSSLLESLPVGVLLVDERTRSVVFANARLQELYGTVRPGDLLDELNGRCVRADGTPFPAEDLPSREALREGRSAERSDMVYVRPDGARIPVVVSAHPLRLGAGDGYDAFIAVVQDRRELDRAFREVEAWKNRFDWATLASEQVVYEWQVEVDRCRFSESLHAVFGWHEDEIPDNDTWNLLTHPDDLHRVRAEYRLSVEQDRPFDYTYRFRHRDGRWRWVRDRGVTRRDESGRTLCVGSVTDVTRRHDLEAELRHAQKMETVGTLAGGIAHDFNNQLTGVLGHLELLMRDLAPDDPRAEHVRIARVAAERCAELTHGLLAFSRKLPGTPRATAVGPLVTESCALLRRMLPATVTLEASVAPGLPPVWFDPAQLQQVLVNLCVNARDAMPEGGRLRVDARPRPGNGADAESAAPQVEIAVSDEGQGMDPEVSARVFEPFFTTKPEGVGLGLAMVYGTVTQHGGRVEVESEPGAGSTFRVLLPVAEEAAPEVEADETAVPAAATGGGVALVADDEPVVLGFAARTLEQEGWTVLRATDGDAVLRQVESHGAALRVVLLDLTMPGAPTRELVRRVREEAPGAAIVLSSGFTPDATLLRELGGLPFLAKPYRSRRLLEALGEALAAAAREGATRA